VVSQDLVAGGYFTYGTVEHLLSFISSLLHMTFKLTRLERLEKFEAA